MSAFRKGGCLAATEETSLFGASSRGRQPVLLPGRECRTRSASEGSRQLTRSISDGLTLTARCWCESQAAMQIPRGLWGTHTPRWAFCSQGLLHRALSLPKTGSVSFLLAVPVTPVPVTRWGAGRASSSHGLTRPARGGPLPPVRGCGSAGAPTGGVPLLHPAAEEEGPRLSPVSLACASS